MPPHSPESQEHEFKHRAAQFEDWFHDIRERRARKRGKVPTVVPYTGYGSTTWVRVFCRVLFSNPVPPSLPTGRGQHETSIRGWRSFTSVPIKDTPVTISIGGVSLEAVTDRGGVVDTRMDVSLSPGWHTATLHTPGSIEVEATIRVVDPAETFGIISDVDDTVMVTTLPRPFLAAWNTFVLDEHARSPTPGMAVLYERLVRTHPGSPVIYLSTGAWNVAPTLSRFLSRNLYPPGPLLLTDWGPTHDRWFRSGRQHKDENLRRLALEFPHVKWLLVGDDGQHDEQLYAAFAAEHPNSVAAVAIRRLSTGEAVLAGGRTRMERSELQVPWVSGSTGAVLYKRLADIGVLPEQGGR
ncbi:MAG: ACP synthase [Candidatus Lumbricidophila eiseniae]|uniref:ACP synthase n=1 Tax=Candidatus Lumbricidiphila eiseniae TaxID=1969409 RepID=A0A2A6FPJ9_9MICO|nr:MAG: ACP synthase [Candidatus Lumbricidophila eiseniae]